MVVSGSNDNKYSINRKMHRNPPKVSGYQNKDDFSETAKLLGTTALIAGGIHYIGQKADKLLSADSPDDLIMPLSITGAIFACLYYSFKYQIKPTWKEVTEYNHQKNPFSTALTYYNPKTKTLEHFTQKLTTHEYATDLGDV